MGISSVTIFSKNLKKIGAIYKQNNGEPEKWGEKIKKFAQKKKWTNGIFDSTEFNGIEDFATQLISYFKMGTGDIYLTHINDLQEYNYTIDCQTDRFGTPIKLRIFALENQDLFTLDIEEHNKKFDKKIK